MKISLYILAFACSISLNAQETISDLLSLHNTKNIDYISVQELAMPKTNALIFDAREIEEYNVSHIKNAVFVGFNDFEVDKIINKFTDKNQKIVVYCSIGIRSETIAHKLKKAGYTNVFNLFGGIFEWKNNNFPIYNSENRETNNVHVFSKKWSNWLENGNKIY